jgi:Tol biopolymer transport system component
MSLFGGGIRQKITEDNWSDLSLSPDGRQMAFVRHSIETGEFALILANTDGSGERNAAFSKKGTWFGTWSQSVAWSPDGSRIACAGGITSDDKSVWNIRIFRVSDGEEVSFIKSEANFRWISAVAWLPDGDNLLVISGDQSGIGQIYKHAISSGEWRRVTNDLSDYVQLSVPANGKTVITTQEENPGNLWILPADGDASQAKQITFGRNLMTDTTGVSWTVDGKIVYATNAGGRWEIRQTDADGANQKQLTQNCAGNDSCSQPFVSPDGRYIVFQARRSGVANVWRMDAEGGNATQLTFDGGISPSFSPDGNLVIYTRWTLPAATLWQVPVEGGESRQYSKITTAGDAAFSPDGRQMAFHYYDQQAKGQTCIAPVGADAPEKCFAISRAFSRWAADGKAFYYLDHGYAGIWKQPLDGTRELFLEFGDERTNNFAFSPDGKQLVVARSRPTKDIVALTDEY